MPRNLATTPALPGERRVLSEFELGRRWSVSPKTLQRWRCEGFGPSYLKLSKRVVYPLEMVEAFEQQALHASTSERVHGGGQS